MRTTDSRVLVKPFEERGVTVRKSDSGILSVTQYDTLAKTVALADGPYDIKAGDIIFASGTSVKAPWAKVSYDLGNGVLGILMPREAVVLIEPKV
jgi:hypothetical protein